VVELRRRVTHFWALGTLALLIFTAGCSGPGTANVRAEEDVADDTPAPGASADAPPENSHDIGGGNRDLDNTADSDREGGENPPWCGGSYAAPEDVDLTEAELLEASGIVASRTSAGVLWLHNDSGDTPRLFAVGTDGEALGRLTLRGASARDWEDIAAADCPDGGGQCLWVGDLGDNAMARDDAAIYAVREPVVEGPFGDVETDDFWRFPVSYGEERPNVEALLVSPDAADIWVLEKVEGDTARIFHAAGPLNDAETTIFAPAGQLRSPGAAIPGGRMITGADLHPTGRRVLLRVYTGSFEYRFAEGQTMANLGDLEPVLVAPGPLTEGQGEAIAYSADGRDVWTISESQTPRQPLHLYRCSD
jgi:hypothetical protein